MCGHLLSTKLYDNEVLNESLRKIKIVNQFKQYVDLIYTCIVYMSLFQNTLITVSVSTQTILN